MAAEVKILIEGWLHKDCHLAGKEPTTAATISLIKDGDIIGIVDPGELPSQQMLIDALARENLKVIDITHIFITHSHIDHYRNAGMFPETTRIVEFFGEWQEGRDRDIENGKYSDNIEIVKTPGHNRDALTFLVQTTSGKVAVVGDVFWKENYPENDPYATDMPELIESRKKVLELADYIIPGHGGMFKVN
ncbi:MAG: MBL fold metallo-hydrolase [Patescibacteria group bacterium]